MMDLVVLIFLNKHVPSNSGKNKDLCYNTIDEKSILLRKYSLSYRDKVV